MKKSIFIIFILLILFGCKSKIKKSSDKTNDINNITEDKTSIIEYSPNSNLVFIKEMWRKFYLTDDINETFPTFHDKDMELARLLTKFLKTEESWNIYWEEYMLDNEGDTWFIWRICRSKENNFRIYNIWFKHRWGEDGCVSNIIQYRTKTGKINAEHIDLINNFNYFSNKFGFNLSRNGYNIKFTLEEDAYLLETDTPREINTYIYVALKVYDDYIEPYPVFNGKNTLTLPVRPPVYGEGIYSWDISPENEIPYKIIIDYNVSEYYDNYMDIHRNWDTLEFIYNGSKFIGDYDLLNKLISIR
jgi:hypothetical protein